MKHEKLLGCHEYYFAEKICLVKTSNASKIAFIYLVEKLKKANYKLLDCQVYNNHLASLGAEEIPRTEF
jgi:Leu/Phe-tRNA-protein transferase